jgi:hypothetical protein
MVRVRVREPDLGAQRSCITGCRSDSLDVECFVCLTWSQTPGGAISAAVEYLGGIIRGGPDLEVGEFG